LTEPKKVYWDTCVWLSLINEESGRVERCRHILNEARNGNVEIWTSAFTLAEVFKTSSEGKHISLPESKDHEFENYIQQDFFQLVQVDFDIGVLARRLLREHVPLKKPPDAIHLATAVINNLDEFHTFDDVNLTPLSGLVNRADGVGLLICFPQEPPQPELTEYPEQVEP
jgi:predicted nucleic acid-binding protein